MRKFLILLVVLSIGASAFSQLRVANKSGRDLYVSVDSKEVFIPNKETKTFSATRSVRTVWLDCKFSDGTKFTVSKEVSRSGSVELLPSDNSTSPGIVKEPVVASQPISVNQLTGGSVGYTAPIYNNSSTHYSDSINDLSGSKTSYEDVDAMNKNSAAAITPVETSNSETSLSAILKGSNVSESVAPASTVVSVKTNEPKTPVSTAVSVSVQPKNVQSIVNQVVTYGEPITIEYLGAKTLKIISSEGQGLELIGRADSINNSGVKNKYTIYFKKNADLVIGVGEKKQANQAIWPYGEIRKRINTGDAICKITDADIKMMSTSQTRKLKFRVDAKDYKILIEPDAGELISLGYTGVSRLVDLPIGQSYIRIAYTDPQGVFHPTAFMSVHVTLQDRYVPITINDLSKTFTINNW